MRSKLHLSVSHLPTICENVEVTFIPGTTMNADSGKSPSHTVDEYASSIRQLAQPTSLGSDGPRGHHSSLRKSHKRAKLNPVGIVHGHRRQDVHDCTRDTSCCQGKTAQEAALDASCARSRVMAEYALDTPRSNSSLHRTLNSDPLDWLYGHDGKENKSQNKLLHKRAAGPVDHGQSAACPSRQTRAPMAGNRQSASSSGSERHNQIANTPRSGDHSDVSGKRSRTQRLHRISGGPSRMLGTSQSPHLPVIYEL
ncbi:protein DEPP1 [Ambystoma mexicanum]|uniref:protein DEPP1 n=1 Tax=Ambystoma mexicanum TaxID=8296 RepID=UPI0037E8FA36